MQAKLHRKRQGPAKARLPEIRLRQPSWLRKFLATSGRIHPTRNDRLRLVIEMSRLNVAHGTGGPFAAAVFDERTGILLAPGVNIVEASGCSVAHAEIMAIMTAQKLAGNHDLSACKVRRTELVSSTEPCAMCQGAILWSGISSLVYAARGDDACSIGFDEGPKPRDWMKQFRKRGITVNGGACRNKAVAVLRDYKKQGGVIYNGAFNASGALPH